MRSAFSKAGYSATLLSPRDSEGANNTETNFKETNNQNGSTELHKITRVRGVERFNLHETIRLVSCLHYIAIRPKSKEYSI